MQMINGNFRQVPSLFNLAYSPSFFWEGRETSLESVVLKPIVHQEEMNADLGQLIKKMNKNPMLKKSFKEVFGLDSIYSALVSRALAQYVRSLIRPKRLLVDTQSIGQNLFNQNCISCHAGKTATDFKIRKSVVAGSGLDSGLSKITNQEKDAFFFKTPSLFELKLTAPYMHDGRYKRLDEVVSAYAKALNIKELSSKENQKALVNFLENL